MFGLGRGFAANGEDAPELDAAPELDGDSDRSEDDDDDSMQSSDAEEDEEQGEQCVVS